MHVQFVNNVLFYRTMRLLGSGVSFRFVKNISVRAPHTKSSLVLNTTLHKNAACQVVKTHGDQDTTAGFRAPSPCTEEFHGCRTFQPQGFWKWSITLRTTGVSGLPPSSDILETTKHDDVSESGFVSLHKEPSTVRVSPSPEGGNRSSFRNVAPYITRWTESYSKHSISRISELRSLWIGSLSFQWSKRIY
jgi:hypothetical protein